MREEPDQHEAMEIAGRYLEIGGQIADRDADGAVTALQQYLTDDSETASLHLWYFAGIGPPLVAAAVQKLNGGPPPDGQMWGIEHVDVDNPEGDPDTLTAVRSVVAMLNDEQAYSQDVISAHFDAVAKESGIGKAHESLFRVVLQHLQMLAACQREGVLRL